LGQNAPVRLHVAADDRTGALEVAAALSDRGVGGGAGVPVGVWPSFPDHEVCVVDLESRHLSAEDAALRAAALPAERAAHKIDSTLRGNWAHELVARHAASGLPVMIVPALPALGRVCVDGQVLIGGTPVHLGWPADDVRTGVVSSRPAEHLSTAGALDAREMSSLDDVDRWLADPQGCVVVDARSDDDIDAIVGRWSRGGEVLLAGPSIVIAAAAGESTAPRAPRRLPAPALIVCGSANAAARRQIEIAVERGAVRAGSTEDAVAALGGERPAIVTVEPPIGRVAPAEAESRARGLAGQVQAILRSVPTLGALVVIGGDTAAAVLGHATVHVLGSVTPGTAWVESPELSCPVITRAGGFGDERALADLLWGTLP
jgi:uncharacterized protein YgbK (DUF1537 family)